MDTKKFIIGTLAGTVGSFVAGFLIFGIALRSFMAENVASIDPPHWHWMIIGHALLAALVTFIYMQWAGISTLGSGLKAGAILGILFSLGYNFVLLGSTTLFTGGIAGAIVDAIGGTVIWAVGGAAVGWALGSGGKG